MPRFCWWHRVQVDHDRHARSRTVRAVVSSFTMVFTTQHDYSRLKLIVLHLTLPKSLGLNLTDIRCLAGPQSPFLDHTDGFHKSPPFAHLFCALGWPPYLSSCGPTTNQSALSVPPPHVQVIHPTDLPSRPRDAAPPVRPRRPRGTTVRAVSALSIAPDRRSPPDSSHAQLHVNASPSDHGKGTYHRVIAPVMIRSFVMDHCVCVVTLDTGN